MPATPVRTLAVLPSFWEVKIAPRPLRSRSLRRLARINESALRTCMISWFRYQETRIKAITLLWAANFPHVVGDEMIERANSCWWICDETATSELFETEGTFSSSRRATDTSHGRMVCRRRRYRVDIGSQSSLRQIED